MRKYAIPCVISLLVAALNNIVDRIFIANADYLGSYGNAANTAVFPITVVALAIATLLGDGCPCMMPLATVNKGAFIYLQALGKAVVSTALSLVREIVFGVGLPILLPLVFGLSGVLYSFPVADVLTFAICVAVIAYTYRQLSRSSPAK